MPSAPEIAAELKCRFCGWPLIKDGKLKCFRSKRHAVKATLGEKRIFCPFCQKPKVTLAKNDRAICPKCERGKKEGTPMTTTEVRSKTKELQEWLDEEITKLEQNIYVIQAALEAYEMAKTYKGAGFVRARLSVVTRYHGLTFDEIEVRVAEDRKKLEGYKKQLELLRSARELNVDVDALEGVFGEVVLEKASPYSWIKWSAGNKDFEIYLGKRELKITTHTNTKFEDGRYKFEGVKEIKFGYSPPVKVYLRSGQDIAMYPEGEVYM